MGSAVRSPIPALPMERRRHQFKLTHMIKQTQIATVKVELFDPATRTYSNSNSMSRSIPYHLGSNERKNRIREIVYEVLASINRGIDQETRDDA